jgi:GntR family transcriptional regulator
MNPVFSDKIPLSFQLSQVLRERIMQAEFAPGARLPTEVELAQDFGVSVITVQRALKDLSSAGLITRHRRRGTFVSSDRPALVQPQHSDALSLMFSDEFSNDTLILEKEIIARPERLRRIFPDQPKLLHIRRVVRRGAVPWSYAAIYLLPEFAKRITRPMIKRYPMFRLLREKLGLNFRNVTINLQARAAGMEVARILQIDSLTAVTVMNATLFDKERRAINWLESYYRGDSFVFRLEMNLENDDPLCG